LIGLEDWLILGDFNLIHSPLNRSKPGGNVNEMLIFNDLIQHQDLVEFPPPRKGLHLE
jgi:hypothetical protein